MGGFYTKAPCCRSEHRAMHALCCVLLINLFIHSFIRLFIHVYNGQKLGNWSKNDQKNGHQLNVSVLAFQVPVGPQMYVQILIKFCPNFRSNLSK